MQRCAHCLQGDCSIAFEAHRTVFELTFPALARLDESILESASLSEGVWAIGIDDCDFQRLVLEQVTIFHDLPRPLTISYALPRSSMLSHALE